ncbi:AfsR/SARP family transcriptional regulator [Crossiella cryophila]|uniref:DNA-binding SARP family transcriptional activator/DNA polymerase III delta prime subunit n=1 Tax=Crossiella cryophila TaxID=43355 RepID=A0A7W7FT11_9PSEU|nr:BTAD domain-containing putative transcriptional regulator [Crossiella cryophila]MBB4674304.1 DNA-binding SARP family transcriptional activator/DNA polymerase III delta prime subunit [Crossiella cryophila]
MRPAFGVLGPLLTPAGPIGATKHRILLACLLLRAGEVVPVEELTGHLWEFDPPAQPRAAIQTYIRRLRQSLGPTVIQTAGRGYLADIPPESVDVFRFRDLTRSAETADAADRSRLLGEALGLWRGQPFADVPSASLRADYGVRLAADRVQALELRFAAELELGHSGDLVADLRAATTENPLHEEFWAQLMLALYRADRQAEALEAFAEAGTVLTAELGAGPGARLRELHQKVLTADRSLAPRAARSFQLAAVPTQLPPAIPDFVGRTRLRAELADLLRRSASVVISGPPGVGKTALATNVGHTVRGEFPDGQLYVNLRGFAASPPIPQAEVLSQFLRGFGMPREMPPIAPDRLAKLLREHLTGRRVLVVLDNAASAEQVRDLLPPLAGCAVMITSRNEPAGLTDVEHRRLDVLTDPEAQSLLISMLGRSAIESNPDSTRELTGLCGYLPLALRIAAANVTDPSATALHDTVAALRAGSRLTALAVIGDEQVAVRTAFDLSYDSLDADARQLFRFLSLVPGLDFDARAAATLLDRDNTESTRLLQVLHAANLILHQHHDRYQFHDLLREYSTERRNSTDPTETQFNASGRLLDYYLVNTDAATRLLNPGTSRLPQSADRVRALTPRNPEEAANWLAREQSNLVAATTRAQEFGHSRKAWELADALRPHLLNRSSHADRTAVSEAGLSAAEADGSPTETAAMLYSQARTHFLANEFHESRKLGEKALKIFLAADLKDNAAHALLTLGSAHGRLGNIRTALDLFLEGARLFTDTGNSLGHAVTLTSLSACHWYLGELEEMVAECHSAMAINSATDNPNLRIEAVARLNLGGAYREMGMNENSRVELDQALRIYQQFELVNEVAVVLASQAQLELQIGNYSAAVRIAEESIQAGSESGTHWALTRALNVLAASYRNTARDRDALYSAFRALRLARTIQHLEGELDSMIEIATCHLKARKYRQAARYLTIARSRGHGGDLRFLAQKASVQLAHALCGIAEFAAATVHARQALEFFESTKSGPGAARAHQALGVAILGTGAVAKALPHLEAAASLFAELGMPEAVEAQAMVTTTHLG